jgi:histidine decarboxylase
MSLKTAPLSPDDSLLRTATTPEPALSVPAQVRLAIGRAAHDADSDTADLHRLFAELHSQQPRILGFPGNLDWDLSRQLGPGLGVLLNNVGDPDSGDHSNIHVKAYERAVIDFFAETAGARADDVYGYITAGGSESVLYGLAIARQALPHAAVYASDQAHDCVARAAELLRMRRVVLRSHPDGTTDSDHLRHAVRHERAAADLAGGPGAIVVATVGTTMQGAVDDVPRLRHCAAAAGQVYVHVDAASGGLVAAHAPSRPAWDFTAGADSLSISGHKILGSPLACGVVLSRRRLTWHTPDAEYTGAVNHTLGCSRSGLAALALWARLRSLGHEGVRGLVHRCLDVAQYATERLEEAGARPQRFPDSLTVTFDRPSPAVVRRYHLAPEGMRAHIVCVGHVTRQAVDALCRDITAPDAS